MTFSEYPDSLNNLISALVNLLSISLTSNGYCVAIRRFFNDVARDGTPL
jgi:hypothetical protein